MTQTVAQITDWDDAYANGIHIPGGAEFPDRWATEAAAFRQTRPPELTGLGEFYRPEGTPRGLSVLIHGGYWMKFAPQVFSHWAGGALARGWAVLLPGYTLAPEASLAAMRDEIAVQIAGAAMRVAGPIVLSGHSAGGHLAARLICQDTPLPPEIMARLARCVPISGLFDLRPLQRTDYREPLGLDDRTARAESLAFHLPAETIDLHLWVGADERPVFVQQTHALFHAWAGIPRETRLTVEPGRHHMDVVAGLTDPQHPLTKALVDGL